MSELLLNSPTHYRLQDFGTLKLCVLSTGTSSSDIGGWPGKWRIIKGDQILGKQLRLLLLQSVNWKMLRRPMKSNAPRILELKNWM